MPKRITEKSFYKYLKCPSWIAHEAKEEALVEDALRAKLQDDGLLHEEQLKLLSGRRIVEVVTEDTDEAVQKTLEYMHRGEQTIFRPVLTHGHWVARPDILERVEGKSDLGSYYYVACDIKRSRRLKDEYCFQGCFYAELLGRVQGTKPVQGYVMHTNGEVESYLLEEYSTKFHLTLDAIERILEGQDEPHFLTSDCKQSPWYQHCVSSTHACDDLSRLNRVWRSEVRALQEAGIHTVTDFAKTTKDFLDRHVHGITGDRLAFLQEQAKALIERRIITLGKVDLPSSELTLVMDVESDPLRDVHYLIGMLEVRGDVTAYRAFVARKPEDEREMWNEFCSYLQGIGRSVPILHYGWFEVEVVRSLKDEYGMPEDVWQSLPSRMVDVLTRMRERVIFPLSFYSLKDVAKHLDFRWRTSDASGLDSISWYEDWLRTGNEKDLQKIIDYNEDDVRATWHVAHWAKTQT